MNTLEIRVQMLERSNRRAHLICVVACAVAGAAWLSAFSQPERKPRTLRAERFELIDEKNRVIGLWHDPGSGPRLAMFDESDKAGIQAFIGNGAPTVLLADADGSTRLQLDTKDNGGAIRFVDAGGRTIRVLADSGTTAKTDAEAKAIAELPDDPIKLEVHIHRLNREYAVLVVKRDSCQKQWQPLLDRVNSGDVQAKTELDALRTERLDIEEAILGSDAAIDLATEKLLRLRSQK